MEPILLTSLCIVGQIENASKPEEATDESVEKWFKNRLRTAPRDLAERVRSSVDSVAYKVSKEDPQGAALTFVLDVVKALERNNASDVFKDKERCKGLINKLVFKLEPAELKESIKDARECWSSDEKSSISFFQERVSALAIDVAQGELARAILKRIASLTSEGRKKELLDEFYQSKKSSKAVSKVSDHIRNGSDVPDDNEGRYRASLEDCVNVTALGDYGSDKSVFPATLIKSLIKGAPHLTITKLDQPMVFK
eukprot:IDg23074t1